MPPRPSLPRTLHSLAVVSALLALIAFLVAPLASARQEAPPPAEAQAAKFESPLAVVEAFRQIYTYEQTGDRALLAHAAETLPASGVGRARQENAERLAKRLARVFDHVAVLDPERAKKEIVEDAPNRAHWSVASEADPARVVTLGFEKGSDGSWRFDRRTVESIDAWYTQFEDLPRIAAASTRPRTTTEIVRSFVPRELKGGGFLMEPWQWVGLLCLLLVAFSAERLITLFVRPMIRRLSQFEGVQVAPELLAKFERPFGWLLLGWLFLAGVQVLDLPTGVYSVLRVAIGLFTTVATVWAAYALVSIVCWPLQVRADKSENKFDDMLVPLLRRTLKLLVVLVGLIYIVSRLTGDIWHVLAGLSIGSLAVGFAAKDSIENLFGTFTVLMDGPFKIGDVVKFADIEGTVEEVGFRSTRIRTGEDSLITVPNSRFISSHVDNLGSRRARRIVQRFGLTYDTPPESIEAFCEGVRELIRQHPHTRNEGYHVWLAAASASSLDVELQCSVEVADHATFLRERHRLFLDVIRLAKRLGISFAFPTTTVWIARPEDRAHPDAPPDSVQAVLRGREEAKELAGKTVGRFKDKPPLVRYDHDDPDAIGW